MGGVIVERMGDSRRHEALWHSRKPILAAKVEVEAGIATDRLIRVPSGHGEPEALREVVEKEIDAAFGNSRWDTEMLSMAKHAFAVNPNPDLEVTARERGWQVYFPEAVRTRLMLLMCGAMCAAIRIDLHVFRAVTRSFSKSAQRRRNCGCRRQRRD